MVNNLEIIFIFDLLVAAANGYDKIVKYLCSKKKTKINALDYLNHTPLYSFILNNYFFII